MNTIATGMITQFKIPKKIALTADIIPLAGLWRGGEVKGWRDGSEVESALSRGETDEVGVVAGAGTPGVSSGIGLV